MATRSPSLHRPGGMFGFTIVWIGQIISVLASAMSQFGLTIWMYQQTGSATAMGLMQVFFITPFLIISPIAGVMVDRYNRKLMMMLSDLTAVVATFTILVLQASGQLQFWHLYFTSIIYGLGNAFQWPAYSAAISTMLPKEQYGRANGMMSIIEAGPGVLAPLLAGALLPLVGLTGLLMFDVITFFLAVGALLLVEVPQPAHTVEGQQASGNLFKQAAFGFRYIFDRKGLFGLVSLFLVGNLFSGIAMTVFAPLILARTNSNSTTFGIVEAVAAGGGVAGGLIMSAWGGPKRRINGLIGGWVFSSLLGTVAFGLGRDLWVWIPTIVIATITGPIINGCSQAIWQAKVAPDLQGRVFAARRMIAWITNPLSPIIGGLLADRLLEPAMRVESSPMASVFSPLVGTGPGAGMSLLYVFCGLIAAAVTAVCYFIPAIRHVEDDLPDHDQLERVPQPAGE